MCYNFSIEAMNGDISGLNLLTIYIKLLIYIKCYASQQCIYMYIIVV